MSEGQPELTPDERLRAAAQAWADGHSVMFDTDVALVEAINETLAELAREREATLEEVKRAERAEWRQTKAEGRVRKLQEAAEAVLDYEHHPSKASLSALRDVVAGESA